MKSQNIQNPAEEISRLFVRFGDYIKSEEVRELCRKRPHDFTRIFKFPWFDILLYLIFRCKECVSSEISNYYSQINNNAMRISRQAAFKAIKKLNPRVFPALIKKFALLFYDSNLVKTYRGYILLAEDGTTLNLFKTGESIETYGFTTSNCIKNENDAKKATSRSAALYDVTNGIIVDFVMKKYKDSEIPIAIEKIQRCYEYFKNRAVIYLADRYYGSVELFSILEHYGMKYCIRAKSNFFKHYISKMKSNDEWINVHIDKAWQRRLKYDQPKERFAKNPWIKIRVVKFQYIYYTEKGVPIKTELMYFTNLSEDEFSSHDIVKLYGKRWDLECSYKTLKSDYEWERHFTRDCDSETCSIYAKVLFHNFNGLVRKELNQMLQEELVINEDNKYQYSVNIKQLGITLHDGKLCRWIRNHNEDNIVKLFDFIVSQIHKIKVPIRPDRHEKRWGRVVTSSQPMRFRLDGRNWSNTVLVKGHLQTVKPK